jgi:hypothetical protein
MLRSYFGMTHPKLIEQVNQMGPVQVAVAFTGVFGFLDRKINHLTGSLKYGKGSRMQLIDHGMA